MSFQQIRHRAEPLRALPLESVLGLSGAQPDRYDKFQWPTPQGTLSVHGAKFMNWNRGVGGGGAIDLGIHLNRCGFPEALAWLERHFPGPAFPKPAPPSAPPNLKLPPPDPHQLGRVQDYLVTQRGLAPALIDSLIHSGSLYADGRANAVFLLRGPHHLPVGAELRGTTACPWRGLAPGSRKDLGFFSVPAAPRQTILLCESAIDALSCFALYPQHRCLSTADARPNPLWLPPLIEQGAQIYCRFDADPTGEAMAQARISLHPTIHRLRPPQHHWNDALRSQS